MSSSILHCPTDAMLLLERAFMCGDGPQIEHWMDLLDPHWNNSALFRLAARYGHVEWMQRLLPYSDPKACNNEALRRASEHGYLAAVEWLLPHSDATALESEALRLAAHNGHWSVAHALIPHSNPSDRKSEALLWACVRGHGPLVQALLPYCAPEHLDEMRQSALINNQHAVLELFPNPPKADEPVTQPPPQPKESLWMTWTNKVIKKKPVRRAP